jgi:serine/threonine protein kinase
MQDLIGHTLGHYRVVEKVGEGGMGEVYRATDERLDRDVAIKVLPTEVAQDTERLVRFEREAKLLASLSNQNIATLFGIEEHGGQSFLVMELAEGETLADRIERAPIPIDDAADWARQIAEGLEAAHENGIVHRDLKPANVMLSPEGQIKILDFGLAKARHPEESDVDLNESPTLTAGMTRTGTLLGTAAYMSPEQARGKVVDKRTDVWAFGCVLYELLARQQAFQGEDTSQVAAAILRDEPDWDALPLATPSQIRRLLARCLSKNARNRLHDIADARIELQALPADDIHFGVDSSPPVHTGWRTLLPWGLAAVFGALAVGMVASTMNRAESPRSLKRFVVDPPDNKSLATAEGTDVAISPDGNTIAYVARHRGSTQLCIRSIDDLDVSCVAGTEGGRTPFFSPDGRWLGYFSTSDQKLKKLPMTTGPSVPVEICAATGVFSASWGPDDTIVFGSATPGRGISRVSADGGDPVSLTVPSSENGEVSHDSPVILPDGKTMLFAIRNEGGPDDSLIVAQDLTSGERMTLTKGGTNVSYSSTDHIIYNRAGSLLAAPFDRATLDVGTWTPVEDGVRVGGSRAGEFALSEDGTLVYVHGVTLPKSSLVWASRHGEEAFLRDQRDFYQLAEVSPDGEWVAIQVRGVEKHKPTRILMYDLDRRVFDEWSFGRDCWTPVWSPDSSRIAFVSRAEGPHGIYGIYLASPDEFEVSEPIFTSDYELYLSSWSPDGDLLAYVEVHPETNADISLLSLEEGTTTPLKTSSADEYEPSFSPDGGWVSYVSNESGKAEVFVQTLSGADGTHRVSTDGGYSPSWAPSGRELIFRNDQLFLSVPVSTDPKFRKLGQPHALFEKQGVQHYDVHPDGGRFLFVRESGDTADLLEIRVILNWAEELKRLVPTN